MNQELIDFYKHGKPNASDHTLEEILGWDNEQWEGCHNHIQWILPLTEPSKFNSNAPLLDDETIHEFQTDPTIKNNVPRVFVKAMDFFFNHSGKPYWFEDGDHNLLRITRMIRFMTLLNYHGLAYGVYLRLTELADRYPNNISEVTWQFWQEPFLNATQKM